MEYFMPYGTELTASRLAVGCMRISSLSASELDALVKAQIDCGINFFDHADIYGNGRCEEKFGELLAANPDMRDKIIIQTKVGIKRGKGYDFSPEYLTSAVDGSLKRLKCGYADVLLLHRPDTLMEPDAVAEVFRKLHESGKVKYFGVSNFNSGQMQLLQKSCDNKLIFNQLQLGPTHTSMIDEGLFVNTRSNQAIVRDGGVLDYCRLNGITVQPWSPFKGLRFGSKFNLSKIKLRRCISQLAAKYGTSDSAIVLAWLLRHPAKLQPIIGSTNIPRTKQMCKATDITLNHDEWYAIYHAAGNKTP